MREYGVQVHKGHLIYAAATPADGNKRWYAEKNVFSTNFPEPAGCAKTRRVDYD